MRYWVRRSRPGTGATLTAGLGAVLVSLLHLHHVRAHVINPVTEAMCHRLARAVALSAIALETTTETST